MTEVVRHRCVPIPRVQYVSARHTKARLVRGGGAGVGGTPGSTRKAGPMSSQGIAQNHGSPMRRDITGPGQDANAAAHGGAPQANQGIY